MHKQNTKLTFFASGRTPGLQKMLAVVAVMVFFLVFGTGRAATASSADQMHKAVVKLVAAAKKRTTLWPWKPALPEVRHVAAYGRAVAPLLLARLADDPESDEGVDWNVQQQVALALCMIYGVKAGAGHVYDNRAFQKENRDIKAFWRQKLAHPDD